jgi:uncharacterized damage-inducible protein DinB
MKDAFGHHEWATLQLIDVGLSLTPEQLDASTTGTYGSILGTLRHVVGGDRYYLTHFNGNVAGIDEDTMNLGELRVITEENGRAWTRVLSENLDPDAVMTDVDSDGYTRDAPVGIRLAQALQHGNEHRSQVCTMLTAIGVQPPELDVWDFGEQAGTVVDRPPES